VLPVVVSSANSIAETDEQRVPVAEVDVQTAGAGARSARLILAAPQAGRSAGRGLLLRPYRLRSAGARLEVKDRSGSVIADEAAGLSSALPKGLV